MIDNVFMFISGKSLISKEKAVQKDENEKNAKDMGLKKKSDQVFFISMVGANQYGIVDEHEHIFDLYTKAYDFLGSDVQVISARDLYEFYQASNERADRKKVDVYFLVEYFVQHHPEEHYIIDECPFVKPRGMFFTFLAKLI